MNEVIKALLERRSIRSFKKDLPSKEDIETILNAGLYAPSGKNKQDVISICVTNEELIERLRKANCEIGGYPADFDPFYGAPVIIIVLADKDNYNHVPDGSLVMSNMMLAAHSLGLGSLWVNRARQEFEMTEFKEILDELGIEGNWEGIGHCAIGYIDGDIPKPHPRKANRIYYYE